jgi:hypothetical protein
VVPVPHALSDQRKIVVRSVFTPIMRKRQERPEKLAVIALFCLLGAFAGCASRPYRINPDRAIRTEHLQVLALVPAEVSIYQASPGGLVRLQNMWSETGRHNLNRAILQGFAKRHYAIRLLRTEESLPSEMKQVLPLYRAVDKSIRLHTYGPQIFPDKVAHFDYSVGPLKELLEKLHCDTLLFARGYELVSEGPGKTYMSLALADASGAILWYGVKGSRGDHDLRDSASAAKLVEGLLSDFPEKTK